MLTYCSASSEQLFFSLPNELQVLIIAFLPLTDLLKLRVISKSWLTLVTLHQVPIVRLHLKTHVPAYALRLYPAPDTSSLTLHHLCGIWHRLHVAAKLAFLICEWLTKEQFLRTSIAAKQGFAIQHERMRRRLIPLIFTIYHYFEKYRALHLEHIRHHDGHGLREKPYTLNPIEVQIMNQYDDKTLLRVHEVFPLVMSAFCRRFRPPTYVGTVEKSLRGYLKDRPSDQAHVTTLCLGGLRQAMRFWVVRGYNDRVASMDTWHTSIIKQANEASPLPPKQRKGFMNLGRKKSMAFAEVRKRSRDDGVKLGSDEDQGIRMPLDVEQKLVLSTSLSAGVPMGPLTTEYLRTILLDLPSLQEMWRTTAEALILDRGILHNASEIRRNQQVLLELIRDHGDDEEDEWLYGRSAHESLRRPTDATMADEEDYF